VAAAQTLYEVQDLGAEFRPEAISNNRIIVGYVPVGDPYFSFLPMKWQDGDLSYLPIPDSPAPEHPFDSAWATDISDNGEYILGGGYFGVWDQVLIWRDETAYSIREGVELIINNQGHFLWRECSGYGCRTFFDEDGHTTLVLDSGGWEYWTATAMNNRRQVLGYMDGDFGIESVFWDADELYQLEEIIPIPAPYDSIYGADINDSGEIIGSFYNTDEYGGWLSGTAFLFDAGEIHLIGDFWASSINASSQVVGEEYLYEKDTGRLVDLNGLIDPSAGWQINHSIDINDAGDIIGSGQIGGEDHAILLAPCEANTYFYDGDGDGYGDPRETLLACSQPDGYLEAERVEELVINGGMEGDSNWQDWESPLANERTDAQAYQGNYSRYLAPDRAYDGIRSEKFRLRAGRRYRATFWVYGDGSAPLRALVFRNARNFFHYKPNNRFPVPPAGWTRYSWTFRPTTTGNYSFYIEQAPRGPIGEFYIDNVSVTRSIAAISDCNDSNAAIHPRARERNNGIDDDCDGLIDE
jgi:hypothetical protein